MVSLTTRPL